MRLWSRGDDWVSNQVFWHGWSGYEPECAGLFYRLAERSSLTVDVGAHVGFYSILAALANSEGRVLAFEPMPGMYVRLEHNVALNGLSNVECVRAAVTDESGSVELFHGPAELACSTTISTEFAQSYDDHLSSLVRALTLDDFIRERGGGRTPELVKLDIEAAEPSALRGMRQILEARPVVICEVLPIGRVASEIEELLRPLGYEFFHLTPEGIVRRERIAAHPEWLNYLFAHPSGALSEALGESLLQR